MSALAAYSRNPLAKSISPSPFPLQSMREEACNEVEGCLSHIEDLEQRNVIQASNRLPRVQLLMLLYIYLAEPITKLVVFPFIVQLIEGTGVTGGNINKVGYYVGLMDSLLYMMQAFTVLQWGRLSDRIGRRPVLFIGLFGMFASMICFGLSHTFLAMMASRGIAGILNGNLCVVKSMMGEITDETNIKQGFALLPLVWAVGNTVAPLIGALLHHPYERFGGIFRRSEFWLENPYFLPCAAAASMSASAFLASFFLLKETAPYETRPTAGEFNARRGESPDRTGSDAVRLMTEDSPLVIRNVPSLSPTPPLRTLLTRPILITILNYSLLTIIDISFHVLQPLVYGTPISHGGLGMSPSTLGTCMAGFGLANGAVSALLFAPLTKRFGIKRVATISVFSYFWCYALFPVMNKLARINAELSPIVWVAFCLQLALATLPLMAFSCILVYQTHAAPTRAALGATNGLAQTAAAVMRSLGPAAATSVFALSMEHQNVFGGHLVYVLLCCFTVLATLCTGLLPVDPWDMSDD